MKTSMAILSDLHTFSFVQETVAESNYGSLVSFVIAEMVMETIEGKAHVA